MSCDSQAGATIAHAGKVPPRRKFCAVANVARRNVLHREESHSPIHKCVPGSISGPGTRPDMWPGLLLFLSLLGRNMRFFSGYSDFPLSSENHLIPRGLFQFGRGGGVGGEGCPSEDCFKSATLVKRSRFNLFMY